MLYELDPSEIQNTTQEFNKILNIAEEVSTEFRSYLLREASVYATANEMKVLTRAINNFEKAINYSKKLASQKDFLQIPEEYKDMAISSFRENQATHITDVSTAVEQEFYKDATQEMIKQGPLKDQSIIKFMWNIEGGLHNIKKLSSRNIAYIVSKVSNAGDQFIRVIHNIYAEQLCDNKFANNFIDTIKKTNNALQRVQNYFIADVVEPAMVETLYATTKKYTRYRPIRKNIEDTNLLGAYSRRIKIAMQSRIVKDDKKMTGAPLIKDLQHTRDEAQADAKDSDQGSMYINSNDCTKNDNKYNTFINEASETPRDVKLYVVISTIVSELVDCILCF